MRIARAWAMLGSVSFEPFDEAGRVASSRSRWMPRLGEGRARGAWLAFVVAVLALGAAASARTPVALGDTTITVNTQKDEVTANDGLCSLKEADQFAKGNSAPDCVSGTPSGTTTIVVPAGCYQITGILRMIGTTTVWKGAGPGPASCNGGGTVVQELANAPVVFNSSNANATLNGMTLTGGHPTCFIAGDPECNGGGVHNDGTLMLRNVLITGNAAGDAFDSTTPGGGGGGIYSSPGASLTIEDSTISDNRAGNGADGAPSGGTGTDGGGGGSGGGIESLVGTMLTIERSTISGNHAGNGGAGGDGTAGGAGGRGGYGAGIIDGQSATISDSTISGNVAGAGGLGGLGSSSSGGAGGDAGHGGGIHHQGNSLTLTNVTLTGNAAGTAGDGGDGFPNGGSGAGGVGGAINASGDATMRNVTIVGNSAGLLGGGIAGGANISETASIIAGNSVQNCQFPIADGGGNVAFGDNTCPGTQADPKLGPLASIGGPTPTMALLAGSPAIDLANAALCAPTDQRGVARPEGAGCDAGAYEFAPPHISDASAAANGPRSATVSAAVVANLRDTTVLVHYGGTSAYGTTSVTQDAGAGGGAAPVNVQLTGLVPHTTYHAELIATNADGTAGSADLTFTTPSAPAGGGATPLVSAVRQSSARWVQGSALARISRRHKLPVGTRFSFTLNEPAAVSFAFTRTASGRTVNHRCVAPTTRNVRRPSCRRTVVGGRLAFAGHSGANAVRFDGRLSRHRRLQPGRWTLVITATAPAGLRSTPRRLSFTIVHGRR
ncbi:MAG: choice-of-anchor Q domain-containing protein [Solirubrobacteraceae bacterium]